MSTPFDESKHPRGADGTFAQKSYADPGQLDLGGSGAPTHRSGMNSFKPTSNDIVAGATFVRVNRHMGQIQSIKSATIERVTKTQFVLSDGERWKLESMSPVGQTGYMAETQLRFVNDPQVAAFGHELRVRKARNAVLDANDKMRRKFDRESVLELKAAVDALAALMDTDAES